MIRRASTIRAITTAVATIIVAIALVVGAAGLITALRHTLLDDVAEAGRAQASDVVSQLEAGRRPILEVAGSDEQLIQLLDRGGGGGGIGPECRRQARRRAVGAR